MTRYRIDIRPTPQFVIATVSGDFPGTEEARSWWDAVADAARANGVRKIMFVRYGGLPPNAVGIVETLRNFDSMNLRDWRIAIVFWDAKQMVREYQFVTTLARNLGFDLLVCDTMSEAEAFLQETPVASTGVPAHSDLERAVHGGSERAPRRDQPHPGRAH